MISELLTLSGYLMSLSTEHVRDSESVDACQSPPSVELHREALYRFPYLSCLILHLTLKFILVHGSTGTVQYRYTHYYVPEY